MQYYSHKILLPSYASATFSLKLLESWLKETKLSAQMLESSSFKHKDVQSCWRCLAHRQNNPQIFWIHNPQFMMLFLLHPKTHINAQGLYSIIVVVVVVIVVIVVAIVVVIEWFGYVFLFSSFSSDWNCRRDGPQSKFLPHSYDLSKHSKGVWQYCSQSTARSYHTRDYQILQ